MKLSGTEKKFFGVEKLVFLKKKFGKISENFVFDFFSIILLSVDSNIFFENPAPSLFRGTIRLPSCQISEKSNERIPRKFGNRRTNKLTDKS